MGTCVLTAARRILSVASLCLSLAAPAAEPTLYLSGDPHLGVAVPPESFNAWQGQVMTFAPRLRPESFEARGDLDFFAHALGEAVQPFEFTVPKEGWSRLWGTRGLDRTQPAARFGKDWNTMPWACFRLEMVLEQSVPETDWRIVRYQRMGYRDRNVRDFKVKGTGVVTNLVSFGPVRLAAQHAVNGVALECATAGATVKVRSLRIVPVEYVVSWKRAFTLEARPFRAGVTYPCRANGRLVVNGRTVREDGLIRYGGLSKVDITDALRAGGNEIVYTANFAGGYGPDPSFHIEAFAVLDDGTVKMFPSGEGWFWRHGDGPWKKPVALLGRPGRQYLRSKVWVSNGTSPLHAGALDPKPRGTLGYPLFDAEKPIAWTLALPPKVRDPVLSAAVRETVSGREVLAQRTLSEATLPPLPPGAYTVAWTLRSGTNLVDRCENDLVVTGKLDLPECELGAIDGEIDRRKRLVQEIDCTKTESNPSNFLDHGCYYLGAKLNVGRVATHASGAYRETGETRGDLFAYKIAVGRPGRPHILAFDYPDDGDRAIYCAVLDQLAIPFCNNSPPEGSRCWPNATGAVRCGGIMPLSGEKRTLEILFFPGSSVASVVFWNGLDGTRTAVSAIRVYEIEGTLPGLKLPPTERLYGNHNERPLFHNWGVHVTPLLHEYDRNATWRKWAAAYESVVNRIQQLKYTGMNMSIEGGYMYSFGFPSRTGASEDIQEDFDYNLLILKMYGANGISAYLGYEYTCAPDVSLGGARETSDREHWDGTAVPADQVDRYGRQITGHGESVNSFHPAVWASMTNVLAEMYARYAPIGCVKGVVAQTGWLWQPCFGFISHDVTADEVGYDDLTVGCFERETGIDLGLPKTGGERFAKRYELLTGRHREAWMRWRNAAVKAKLEAMRRVVRTGTEKWDFYVSPSLERGGVKAAFEDPKGTSEMRDGFLARALVASSCDESLFDDAKDGVKLLVKCDYGLEIDLRDYGVMFNRGTQALLRKYDGVYFAPHGLNEHIGTAVPSAPGWWWRRAGSIVYETKPSGDNALYDFTGLLANALPKTFFHTWLDVNIPTAHAAQERRAAWAFYATQVGDWKDAPEIRGVQARRLGGDVQLVNNTPWRLSGEVNGEARTLRPFEVALVTFGSADAPLEGSFRFDDRGRAAVAAQIRLFKDPRVRAKAAPSFLAALGAARSGYEAAVLLRSFEALNAVDLALGPKARADFVNGVLPKPQTVAGTPILVWRAGETNAAVKVSLSKGVLRTPSGERAFARLRNREAVVLSAADGRALPNGPRVYVARVRVHGTNGYGQAYAPWKSRYDVVLKDGEVRPGGVFWPMSLRYQDTSVPARNALATDTWFEMAVACDPEGDACVSVDGFLFARRDLDRLHGDRIPDDVPKITFTWSSKDPDSYIDVSEIRLLGP